MSWMERELNKFAEEEQAKKDAEATKKATDAAIKAAEAARLDAEADARDMENLKDVYERFQQGVEVLRGVGVHDLLDDLKTDYWKTGYITDNFAESLSGDSPRVSLSVEFTSYDEEWSVEYDEGSKWHTHDGDYLTTDKTALIVEGSPKAIEVYSSMPKAKNTLNYKGIYHYDREVKDQKYIIPANSETEEAKEALQIILAKDHLFRLENKRLPLQIVAELDERGTVQRLLNPTPPRERGWWDRFWN